MRRGGGKWLLWISGMIVFVSATATADGVNPHFLRSSSLDIHREGAQRRRLPDNSASGAVVIYNETVKATTTTENSWEEQDEGDASSTRYIHMKYRFENVEAQGRPLCRLMFNIEGLNIHDAKTQYGNFECPDDQAYCLMPGTTSDSNPLGFVDLRPDTNPYWTIGLFMPFPGPGYPALTFTGFEFCNSVADTEKQQKEGDPGR